jgi:hypothetical protein
MRSGYQQRETTMGNNDRQMPTQSNFLVFIIQDNWISSLACCWVWYINTDRYWGNFIRRNTPTHLFSDTHGWLFLVFLLVFIWYDTSSMCFKRQSTSMFVSNVSSMITPTIINRQSTNYKTSHDQQRNITMTTPMSWRRKTAINQK